MTAAAELAIRIDLLLGVNGHPDYPGALNGLQADHRGPVLGIAAAVDVSQRVIEGVAGSGANFLLVHHGLFWGATQRLVGGAYRRVRALFDYDIAVYAAHLPLDSHPEYGNNALLAGELGLHSTRGFASYQGVSIGVAGDADLATEELRLRAAAFSERHGGTVRASFIPPGHHTRRWAICTGAGATGETLREAEAGGVDTLICGEGPHHTAVEAPERGIVVLYAGHYATETLGVAAIGQHIARETGLPYSFINAPTGL